MITWQGILIGICMYAAFEGLFFLISPSSAKSYLEEFVNQEDQVLRLVGVLVITISLGVIWFIGINY